MKKLTSYAAGAVLAALAIVAACGCAGPRPLKGGKAVTTRKPAGGIVQTLVQGENPSQATWQTQESVKVRSYILPAGSRMEESRVQPGPAGAPLASAMGFGTTARLAPRKNLPYSGVTTESGLTGYLPPHF